MRTVAASRRAGRGRDDARRDVRLLRGETALLDRERRDVARRVDVVQARHPAELVHADEVLLVLRHSTSATPRSLGSETTTSAGIDGSGIAWSLPSTKESG